MYFSQSSVRRNLLFVFISFVITIFSCSVIRGYDAGDLIPETDYLTFTAEENGATISFKPLSGTAYYSTDDGNTWNIVDSVNGSTITLDNFGDKVEFKGNNITTGAVGNPRVYHTFSITKKVRASGCVDSLRLENGKFQGLTENCYSNMFRNCIGLISAPTLPATTLEKNCYISMFGGTGLTTPPELPAKDLKDGCYRNMFAGCTTLATVPRLPATNLATNCYMEMFSGCTELQLSTERVEDYLYEWKFKATQDNVDSKYSTMFNGVTIQDGTPTPGDNGYVTLYSKTPLVVPQEPEEPGKSEDEDESNDSSSQESVESKPVESVPGGLLTEPENNHKTRSVFIGYVTFKGFGLESGTLTIEGSNVIIRDGKLPVVILKQRYTDGNLYPLDSDYAGTKAYVTIETTGGEIKAASKEFTLASQDGEIAIPAQTLYTDFTDAAATGNNDWNDDTPRVYNVFLTILSAA